MKGTVITLLLVACIGFDCAVCALMLRTPPAGSGFVLARLDAKHIGLVLPQVVGSEKMKIAHEC
jgi:hypothetical protein